MASQMMTPEFRALGPLFLEFAHACVCVYTCAFAAPRHVGRIGLYGLYVVGYVYRPHRYLLFNYQVKLIKMNRTMDGLMMSYPISMTSTSDRGCVYASQRWTMFVKLKFGYRFVYTRTGEVVYVLKFRKQLMMIGLLSD